MLAAAAAAATPDGGSLADDAVTRLYAAINQRDVAALTASLAADVTYTNLALAEAFEGQTAVARFLRDSLTALPAEAQLVVDQRAMERHGSGPTTAAIMWRLVLPPSGGGSSIGVTTLTRGVSFFTLSEGTDGARISSITDSPEHPVKLPSASLAMFGPVLKGLGGTLLPAALQVSKALQDGVGALLQPPNVPSGSPQPAAAPSSSFSGYSSSSSGGVVAPSSSMSAAAAWPGSAPAAAQAALPAVLPPSVPARAGTGGPAAPRGTRHSLAAAAAAAASDAGAGGADSSSDAGDVPDFSGLWVKVPERCDVEGYEAALDVLGLSGLQKVTARLIEGLQVQQTATSFKVAFVTVVPFFRVTEEVPLDGGSSQLGRRDLRFGQQTATARTTPGGVRVDMSWGPPMPGSLIEQYTLLPDGCLCVSAETRVGDRLAASSTVYRRSGGSREQLLADSRRRNPSVAAVVQQQRDQGLGV